MTQLLPDRIVRHAAQRPGTPAIIGEAEIITYGEFAARSAAIASGLIANGLKRGGRVALLTDNQPHSLLAWLGILRAGGSAVALPQGIAADALQRILDDCQAQFVIADRQLELTRSLWPAQADRWEASLMLATRDGHGIASLRQLADGEVATLPELRPDDEFNVIYSSGTTGVPKGIVHTHGIRVARIELVVHSGGFDANARVMVTTPIYTNWSAIALITTFSAGGAIVLHRQFAAERYLAALRPQRVTHSFIVPAQLTRLLDHPAFDAAVAGTAAVKYCAGAPLAASRKREAVARWPGTFLEIYGMTEGAATTLLNANAHPDKLDTVGRPVTGSACHILDAGGTILPPGEVGEIAGGSSASMLGYHNREDLTASIRWTAPDGTACYRSGDLGWLDAEGFLHIAGRVKDMIVSGGMNIYATDLEDTLAAHPDVAEVAVVGIPSEQWGETPLAVVVPRTGHVADAAAIRDWANARLGKFQRISRVELSDALPRGSLGKVVKRELQRRYGG